jgi:hypothetical protein
MKTKSLLSFIILALAHIAPAQFLELCKVRLSPTITYEDYSAIYSYSTTPETQSKLMNLGYLNPNIDYVNSNWLVRLGYRTNPVVWTYCSLKKLYSKELDYIQPKFKMPGKLITIHQGSLCTTTNEKNYLPISHAIKLFLVQKAKQIDKTYNQITPIYKQLLEALCCFDYNRDIPFEVEEIIINKLFQKIQTEELLSAIDSLNSLGATNHVRVDLSNVIKTVPSFLTLISKDGTSSDIQMTVMKFDAEFWNFLWEQTEKFNKPGN